MRHKLLFGAICASAALFVGCNDEDIVKYVPVSGDEIVFGARAGFENGNGNATRTVYSGDTYPVGGKTYERIDWVQGSDIVQIYSPEVSAPGDKTVDYTVSGEVETSGDDQRSYSTLASREAVGLQWGDDVAHTFYALYPSPVMLPNDAETTLKQGVKMDGTKAMGYVPKKQDGTVNTTPIVESGNEVFVVAPDMTYAYMVAKSTVEVAERINGVNMTFYPMVTAVEVTLTNPKDNIVSIPLSGVFLQSTQDIAGAFQCDLSSWTSGDEFAISVPDGGEREKVIYLSTLVKSGEGDGATYAPLTLNPGQSVRVTAFLLPEADITNLSVGFQTPQGMNDKLLAGISIPKNTKYRINGLTLPKTKLDYSKWMSYIPDNRLLKDLSIPGTGGTFSYNYTGGNAELYKAQLLDFEDQWKSGVRAFEIISDRKGSRNTSLESQQVQCNGADMGVEVGDVFRNLLDKLTKDSEGNPASSTETAVVMLTYQPTGQNDDRDPDVYMRNLILLYNTLVDEYGENSFVHYDPSLKLADVRGKLMVLVRATQHVEDAPHAFDELLENTSIVEIDGCGTAKDKWGCRGYEVKVANTGDDVTDWKKALDIQASGTDEYQHDDKVDANHDGYYDYPMVENYMYAELETKATSAAAVPWTEVGYNSHVRKKDMHFEYESNLSGVKIWCQEWQRVVPALYDVNGDGVKDGLPVYLGSCKGTYDSSNPHYFYVFWHDSYQEKVDDIKKTFDMAISGLYENQYLFINSLCGYYVTDPTADGAVKNTSYVPYADDPCVMYDNGFFWKNHSWNREDITFPPLPWSPYWPIGGMEGDIAGLAKDLNNMLYNHILGKSDADFTGPTGLVYMNRVSDTETVGDEGSYYLPSVIIANNFKHN